MTIAVTRDVAPRVRGFLASVMVEVAAGVFAAPRLNPQVRARVLAVLGEWQAELGEGGVTVLWEDRSAPGGLALKTIGRPERQLQVLDGIVLAHTPLEASEARALLRDGRPWTGNPFEPRPPGWPPAPDPPVPERSD